MREIKFRAWDKKKKELLYNGIEFYTRSINCCSVQPGYKSIIGFGGCDCFDLMQYTGLKDKNGVEIYEGDLIRLDLIDRVDQVSFISGAFVVSNKHCCVHCARKESYNMTLYEYLTQIQKAEVIGNIHELIEKGK